MDLDKLIYEMLKEGKSVKEISDATLNAQKKISEEQKSEKLIADCRADLVGATITYLKALGNNRALVTCNVANEASRRIILDNKGVYEDTVDEIERYWIEL